MNNNTKRERRPMKKLIAGMDLHSNNVVIGVMDLDGQRLASRKLPCELKEVVRFLAPFRKRLEQVAVESTYNWYWLVDGLRALNYPVVLANPAGMEQYMRMTPTTRFFWPSCCGSGFCPPATSMMRSCARCATCCADG
jgi:hypothetical protein